jgi:hypothetical protein
MSIGAVANGSGCKCKPNGQCAPAYLEVVHADHSHKCCHEHGQGNALYHWLVKQGCPMGFQILCSYCNVARHRPGAVWQPETRGLVLDKYGGSCVRCGEDDKEFLEVVHAQNTCNEKCCKEHGQASAFYDWLWQHGCPDGFHVLCNVCNHEAYRRRMAKLRSKKRRRLKRK